MNTGVLVAHRGKLPVHQNKANCCHTKNPSASFSFSSSSFRGYRGFSASSDISSMKVQNGSSKQLEKGEKV